MVELNEEVLKVLSSRSRKRIIKSLEDRSKTVSELSRELNLAKSTVHKHIVRLAETGIVVRRDIDNNKFVYYTLSEKGRYILKQAEKLSLKIQLSIALITFVGGVLELYRFIRDATMVKGELSIINLLLGMGLIIFSILLLYTVRSKRSQFGY
jgi:DNA-binding transcriptional ArsR family regulator